MRVYLPITEVRESDTVSERFLSEDERIVVADLLRAKKSLRAIARELGRNPATISREVRRNRDPRTGKYHPFQAHAGHPYAAPAPGKGRYGATRN